MAFVRQGAAPCFIPVHCQSTCRFRENQGLDSDSGNQILFNVSRLPRHSARICQVRKNMQARYTILDDMNVLSRRDRRQNLGSGVWSGNFDPQLSLHQVTNSDTRMKTQPEVALLSFREKILFPSRCTRHGLDQKSASATINPPPRVTFTLRMVWLVRLYPSHIKPHRDTALNILEKYANKSAKPFRIHSHG